MQKSTFLKSFFELVDMSSSYSKDQKSIGGSYEKILAILLVLIISLSVGCSFSNKKYIEKIKLFNAEILSIEKEISDTNFIIQDVWNAAIKGSEEAVTTEGTKLGRFIEGDKEKYDFNTAIRVLYNSENEDFNNFNDMKTSCIKKVDSLDESLTKISKVPQEHQKLYDLCQNNYDLIKEYLITVTDPTGSYLSYTEYIDELSNQIISNSEKLHSEIILLEK